MTRLAARRESAANRQASRKGFAMNAIWINIDEIFAWVARASLYAVAVIAVIVFAQALMRRALSAKWICALWIILLLRLAIPSGPEFGLSLWNLAPQLWVQQAISGSEIPAMQQGMAELNVQALSGGFFDDALQTAESEAAIAQGESPRPELWALLPIIWLAGALSLMCGIIIGNLRLWNTVRRLPLTADRALLELLEECRQSMRVRAKAGLVVTSRVKSPVLFGFIRPRILLPADLARELPFDSLRYILLHELAHLKRRDVLVGWLTAFLQSLHWFNPLVWWAFGRLRFDRELACDEQALSLVPEEEHRRYGDVLIGMLERYNCVHHMPAIAGILENKRQLKRRLVMIKKFKRPARREIIAFAALFAVLSIGLLTEPLLSRAGERGAFGESGIFENNVYSDCFHNGLAYSLGAIIQTENSPMRCQADGSWTKAENWEIGIAPSPPQSGEQNGIIGNDDSDYLQNFLQFYHQAPDPDPDRGSQSPPQSGEQNGIIGNDDSDYQQKLSQFYRLTFQYPRQALQAIEAFERRYANSDYIPHVRRMKAALLELNTEDAAVDKGNVTSAEPVLSGNAVISIALVQNYITYYTAEDARKELPTGLPTDAKLIHSVDPVYPEAARAAQIFGSVILSVKVDEKGTVADITILSGHELLRQAVLDAARQWRFSPATINRAPVRDVVIFSVSFSSYD